ncbi:MAG TPA: hypothetical protein VGF25_10660 [Thermoleophilaceae bacterium]|jgi:hypothetical protein
MSKAVQALLLAAGAALAGCGAGGSEHDVTQVMERFQAALSDGDGAAACAELSESTRSALEQQEKKPCARAVLSLGLEGGGEVSRSKVYITSAFAEADGQAAFLDQTPSGWRISQAGCTPGPDDLPFDCDLED